ncbi:MAG: hypothetical protein COB20_14725 [SAR86 cluster bacterium]|uniref:YdhG-like domain-containing protein n=1 Tax=SAR86 cluster bacterium TaxID=2030880 RepID=A0A2A4WWK2_9GAMM|nr:MAG: hypothetical protein COB20_14725 [SAR86 cluster bacterium]
MEATIREKFESYPDEIQPSLMRLRELIASVAKEYDLGAVEESLKWGELSYCVKGGSAIRTGWRPKSPDKIFVFFHCQTKLIETFNEIYGELFSYEGKRAIVLKRSETGSVQELKHCIGLALRYHKLKHLPLLGV